MDVHKAKGIKFGRQVRKLLKKEFVYSLPGTDQLLDIAEHDIAVGVERSERAKARERRKKAEVHLMTKDMFN